MPFRLYTPDQKAEALAVLAQHKGDVPAARVDLLERWGHAPSLPTLCMWLLSRQNGQGWAITARGPEAGQDGALNRFEPLLEGLVEALGNLSDEYVLIILGKAGRGQ